MADESEDNPQWLLELLQEVQLDQFYAKLRDDLQVTRYSIGNLLYVGMRIFPETLKRSETFRKFPKKK